MDGLQRGGAANVNSSPPLWEGSSPLVGTGLSSRSIATHLNIAEHFLPLPPFPIGRQTPSSAGRQSASAANMTLFGHAAALTHNRVCVFQPPSLRPTHTPPQTLFHNTGKSLRLACNCGTMRHFRGAINVTSCSGRTTIRKALSWRFMEIVRQPPREPNISRGIKGGPQK